MRDGPCGAAPGACMPRTPAPRGIDPSDRAHASPCGDSKGDGPQFPGCAPRARYCLVVLSVEVLDDAPGLRVSRPDAVVEVLVDELVEADVPALPGSEALSEALSSRACVALSFSAPCSLRRSAARSCPNLRSSMNCPFALSSAFWF